MVVGVLKPGLQGVMIDVAHRSFCEDFWHIQSFELQVGHSAGRVLREGGVYSYADLLAGDHFPFNEMVGKYFPGNRVSHKSTSFQMIL